jgi:hypothetical protein
MLTRLVAVIFFCIVAVDCPAASLQAQQPSKVEDADEYALYSATLNAPSSGESVKRYVIARATNSHGRTAFIGPRHGFAPNGATRPLVDPETSLDFDLKTAESSELSSKLTLPVSYTVESEETRRKIFVDPTNGKENPQGWHNFYEKYPGTPGIISFRRAGFKQKKDQAFLYVARQGDFVGGSGSFFVLAKQDNAWAIKEEVILWLS